MPIKIVPLNRSPVVKMGKLVPCGKITQAQLASLEINARSRLDQNAARRAYGERVAGEYWTR